MIEEAQFDQFIFSDGKIFSMACDYVRGTIELRLGVRKHAGQKILPCIVALCFEKVTELDVLEDFTTAGNYSDMVLTKMPNGKVYASFDPFDNSGEPNESDNFVIKAETCIIKEVQ